MSEKKDIKIMVAAHKPYRMPEDDIYYPVHVGAEGKESFGLPGDNTGDNISVKNPNYCELTGLYWMWKNVPSDYLGLVHYRRHFVTGRGRDKWAKVASRKDVVKKTKEKWDGVAGRKDIEEKLEQAPVIMPPKRNYYIETTYNQYAHAHHAIDLDTTKEILQERYPEYVKAFDENMAKTAGHKFNMFIMRRDLADAYCEWLFDILFELERRLDISEYSANDSRVFGFVSERLIDTWLDTNQVEYTEMSVEFMEDQNWLTKGGNFLKRKFVGKKE